MIILAAAIILSLLNSGIIGSAKEAVKSSDLATVKNAKAIIDGEIEIAKSKGNGLDIENYNAYVSDKLKEQGIDTSGYFFCENNVVIIPKGFVVSEATGENLVEKGLVIYEGKDKVDDTNKATAQTTRNQFVWIPIKGSLESNRLSNVTNEQEGQYHDPIDEHYKEVKASIEKYGGFYVGRYEAGVEQDTASGPSVTGVYPNYTSFSPAIDGSKKALSQKDKYPWNNIPFQRNSAEGSAQVAKTTYASNTSIKSSLMYGAQWDAILRFIKAHDDESINWGNHLDSEYSISSTDAKYLEQNATTYASANGKNKIADQAWLLTTGASENFARKNIYDIAGNAHEGTLEVGPGGTNIERGGAYNGVSYGFSVFYQYENPEPNTATYTGGFRLMIYIP